MYIALCCCKCRWRLSFLALWHLDFPTKNKTERCSILSYIPNKFTSIPKMSILMLNNFGIAQWFKMPNSIWKLFWRLYSLEKRFWHTTGLLRHQKIQKKYKRPMKVVKAKSKARRWKITKVYNFFTFLGSLGFFYCMIFIFLSFKVNKAKKAALVAGKANLHWGLFLLSKVLL